MQDKVTIYSYGKVWLVAKKLYAIHTLVLPVPVDLIKLAYFFLFVLMFFTTGKFFPPVAVLPLMLKYGVFPFLLTKFFMSLKLDGKPPQKFFLGYLPYLLHNGEYLERFMAVKEPKTELKTRFDWYCAAEIALKSATTRKEGLRDRMPD